MASDESASGVAETRDISDVVRRARDGDSEAFGVLVERYRDAVFGLSRRMLANVQDAEEATQETFLRAWCERTGLRDEARFVGWLFRIAQNTSHNVRTRYRQPTLPLTGIDQPDARGLDATTLAVRDGVREAIAALSDANRSATSLSYLGGYSVGEVAAILNVPVGTVKRRLHDSRAQIRHLMTDIVPRRRHQRLDGPTEGNRGRSLTTRAERGSNMLTPERVSGHLDPRRLLDAITWVRVAAAHDVASPVPAVLGGVLFDFGEDSLTLAAADGFRLACARLSDGADLAPGAQLVLPLRAASAYQQLLAGAQVATVALAEGGKTAILSADDLTIRAPLIEGKYPAHENFIPRTWRTRVTVDTADLRGVGLRPVKWCRSVVASRYD